MDEWTHRLALGLLFAAGLATLLAAAAAAGQAASLALQHREWMLACVGAALLLAPWVAALRLPAIAAALLGKSFLAITLPAWPEILQIMLLIAAGAILLAEARREARWEGVLRVRQEG